MRRIEFSHTGNDRLANTVICEDCGTQLFYGADVFKFRGSFYCEPCAEYQEEILEMDAYPDR